LLPNIYWMAQKVRKIRKKIIKNWFQEIEDLINFCNRLKSGLIKNILKFCRGICWVCHIFLNYCISVPNPWDFDTVKDLGVCSC
jgi:hypothetical protein